MGARLFKHLVFIFEYVKVNIAMQMEYKASFLTRVFSMLVNDCMWLSFWILYFTRFPVVQGWGRSDVITLWAVCALGYGLGLGIFGNALGLAGTILTGNLDFYLAYPKNVLIHAISGRVEVTNLGDVLFGPLVLLILVKPSLAQWGLFLLSGILVAVIFVSFTVLACSIAFFIGNSEGLASQLHGSLIHFATYPSAIFHGAVKAMLFTVLPAGFINSIPVRLIRDFDPVFLAMLTGAAVGFSLLANRVFKVGLKRYESGNLMQVRL